MAVQFQSFFGVDVEFFKPFGTDPYKSACQFFHEWSGSKFLLSDSFENIFSSEYFDEIGHEWRWVINCMIESLVPVALKNV